MATVTGVMAELISMECGECGTPFGMPRFVYEARLRDYQSFYCPLGHCRVFVKGKSDVEKLRDQVRDLEAAKFSINQQRLAAEAEAARLRTAATRAKKRVAAGVCPCCHRIVAQMARHMKTKHPDYAESK